MTLVSSGEISLGGSTSGRSMNLELGKAAGAALSLNDERLRALCNKASGAISFSDLYAKQFPPPVGTLYGGGYYCGSISHTANSVPTHHLIIAPRATGQSGIDGSTLTTQYQYKTTDTAAPGATSKFDGRANTNAMIADGISKYPAAQFCTTRSINGYSDWYLPSYYEMKIFYINLKSHPNGNNTLYGENPYSVPRRNSNYTTWDPPQTTLAAWKLTVNPNSFGPEACIGAPYVCSTDSINELYSSALYTWGVNMVDNNDYYFYNKTSTFSSVRAMRRIAV